MSEQEEKKDDLAEEKENDFRSEVRVSFEAGKKTSPAGGGRGSDRKILIFNILKIAGIVIGFLGLILLIQANRSGSKFEDVKIVGTIMIVIGVVCFSVMHSLHAFYKQKNNAGFFGKKADNAASGLKAYIADCAFDKLLERGKDYTVAGEVNGAILVKKDIKWAYFFEGANGINGINAVFTITTDIDTFAFQARDGKLYRIPTDLVTSIYDFDKSAPAENKKSITPHLKNVEISSRYNKEMTQIEELIKPLIKDSVKIEALKASQMPPDSNLKSHFGGLPYFERGEAWPKSKDGKNLEFVFQAFSEDGFSFPDDIKLIQFFCDLDEINCGNEDGTWLVKTYGKIDKTAVQLIPKPPEHNEIKYCGIKLSKAKSIPDLEDINDLSPAAAQVLKDLDSADIDVYYALQSKLVNDADCSSHIGGYPHWVQSSECPNNSIMLFQLDYEDNANLMLGDCGSVYIFYNTKTKETEFVFQCS